MLAPDSVKRNLNSYPYCDNDPVNYNDPTGEIPTILAGGLLGGLFGGASGFLGSTISQVTSGEEFNWRKALGAGANGAVVGAARGALIGSGAGIPAAFATDFLAGASGNALEQWITKERADRIDIGESLVSGISNAFGQMLYGTGQIKGLGDAFIRGARSGAAVSGLENIAGALGLTGRDPRRMCGSPDPFDLESGLGGSEGYHGGAGHSRIGNGGGFSLGSFVKDTLTGAVAGGLGSAGFYGAGKAVEALRGSVVGRRNVSERDIVPKPNHGQGFSRRGYNPQDGERTFEGYVRNNANPEISLYTKSAGFNNSKGNIGGQFKRLGAKEHYGLAPHVHQPVRSVAPNGIVYGRTGKKVGVDTLSPSTRDVKQMYEYLNNEKYHQ